jgi:hypothetical protein
MRLLLAILLVAALGAGLGLGAAVVEWWRWPYGDVELLDGRIVEPGQTPATSGPQPRVAVDEETHDFGIMDVAAEGSHDFVFTNQGDGPLALSAGETSCSCAVAEVTSEEIPPGGEAVVTVQWNAEGRFGPFRQTATIETNDPTRSRVVLTIEGKITRAVVSVPSDVVFSRVMVGQEATAETRLYCYLPQSWEITGYDLAQAETAGQFEVAYEPLTAEQLEEEPDAQSGYLVRVTAKSGLPLGPFQQTIRFQTSLEDAPTVEVPVEGTVRSEISIVGGRWNNEAGVLMLGTVSSREGAQHKLLLLAAGPERKEVQFTPVATVPDLLQVEVGETAEMPGGQVTQTPLFVRIPQGCRPANYLGPGKERMGRITIGTNHPDAPRLEILVQFAVEG